MHKIGLRAQKQTTRMAAQPEPKSNQKRINEKFESKSLPLLAEHLEANLRSFGEAYSTFEPENLMSFAQRDLIGERFFETNINGRDLVKETANENIKEVGGLFISCVKNCVKKEKKVEQPGEGGFVTYIENETEVKIKKPSVSIIHEVVTDVDGSSVDKVEFSGVYEKLELPKDVSNVRINGYEVTDYKDVKDIKRFLSDRTNFKRVMGSALALRILNEALPDATAYDDECELFSKIQKHNPEAAQLFLNRTRLIQQCLSNAVSQTMGEKDCMWASENNRYTVIVEKSEEAKSCSSKPSIDSQQFTEFIRDFKISVHLSAQLFGSLLEPGKIPEKIKAGVINYTTEIAADGTPSVTSISMITDDGSCRGYVPHKQSEEALRAASEHRGFRARVKHAIGRSAS